MFGIVMKDLRYWILYPAGFFIALNAYYFAQETRLSMEMTVLNSFFIYFLVVWPMLTIETAEERYRGYEFLRTLPLRMRDVVFGKFVMPLVVAIVLAAANVWILGRFGGAAELLSKCRGTIIANASITLVIAALVQVLAYRYGVKSLMVALGALILLLNVLGLLAMKGLVPGVERAFRGFGSLAPGAELAAAAGAAVAAYFALMAVAIRVRSAVKG